MGEWEGVDQHTTQEQWEAERKTLPASYILYVATHGMDDPTRAALAFAAANQEQAIYRDAVIALLGDAVFLMNQSIAGATMSSGRDPLKKLIQEAQEHGIKIYC